MSSSRPNTSAKNAAVSQRKIAAQRAADQRRRNQTWLAVTGIGLVIAILASLVVIKAVGGGGSSQQSASAPVNVSAQTTNQVVAQATGVPAATLNAVGSGGVTKPTVPIANAAALTNNGKPEILYLGAEYCPFCAAERWPLVIALSRFGTFTGLGLTKSGSTDEYPNTNTFTFLNAKYTSDYLAFDPVELQDTNHKTLQTPTAAQTQLLNTYDVAPYTSSPGSIPFIDFGNKFIVNGAGYDPQLLQNQSWNTIAAALSDPSNPIAKSIDGTANQITAAICTMTGDQPSNVCSAPAVASLKAGL